MRFAVLAASLFATAAVADFHLVSQNTGDDVNDTDFFVIGSSADSQDNKCSFLNGNGRGATVEINFSDANVQANHGTGLLSIDTITVTNICSIDSMVLTKQDDGTYVFSNGLGERLGSCFQGNQQVTECDITIIGGSQIKTGTVTEILVCQGDGASTFCDPATA